MTEPPAPQRIAVIWSPEARADLRAISRDSPLHRVGIKRQIKISFWIIIAKHRTSGSSAEDAVTAVKHRPAFGDIQGSKQGTTGVASPVDSHVHKLAHERCFEHCGKTCDRRRQR